MKKWINRACGAGLFKSGFPLGPVAAKGFEAQIRG
jgi:hypothetical protein